jgi:endoglucanase
MLLAGLATATLTPLTVAARGAAPSPAVDRMRAFTTGFNLPGVCDVPPGEVRLPSEELLGYLAKRGFRSIRLPVEPRLCVDGRRGGRRALDDAQKRILGAGLSLTLDMHPGDEVGALLRTDAAKGGELIAAAWRSLAKVAAELPPDRVALELLNEPPLASEDWRVLRGRLVDQIRQRAPDHTLVWGAAQNQTIEETIADPGPDDGNAIAAVHYYYPMVFTHQGQSWGNSSYAPIRQLPFPLNAGDPQVMAIAKRLRADGRADSLAELNAVTESPWTAARIEKDFAALGAWAEASGRPVIVNEFGVYRDYALDGDRVRWLGAVRRAAESNGFGWCHWEFDQGFGFTLSREDARLIDESVLTALLGPDEARN